MIQINVGIVEDTLEYIETLKFLIADLDKGINVIATASTMEEARVLLTNPDIQLAFLDIQLKRGTIFDVLEELLNKGASLPEIIFVTAHGSFEFATKAIKYACLDFITKPVSSDHLLEAIERFIRKENTKMNNSQVHFLLKLLKGNMHSPKSLGVILPRGVVEFIDLNDILYFQSDSNISKLKMKNQHVKLSTKNLGYYIDLLQGNPNFIQISKQCLVNTNHIKKYNHRDKSLLLSNQEALIASHRFNRHLKKELLNKNSSNSLLSDLLSLFKN
ncbi:MAG: response regulator transcription factor [Saprospiraceae bacterium]|nr:response regulator transcription factor [Saprospiraceae bacterium]